ncbi:MAG: GDSL-type esterase/lipase family protein [Oscillospiraceae bacterium]|nr:GDSL-type esterase/lipase family protein [Oscillospiraceae bacterium]
MTRSNRKNKGIQIVFFAVLIAIIILVVYFGKKSGNAQETPAPDNSSAVSEETAVPPSVAETPAGQSEAPSPTPSEPVAAGPDLEAHDPVDDSFFEDAAFMGNSLMDGFRLFSGLTTCDYYAATSMTVVAATSKACITLDNGNAGTIVDGVTQKPYGKIYILLGINEIGFDVQTFIDYYSAMLDTIITAQPDCDIYIMGITPVSEAKSNSSTTFNMTRITEYNTALRQLAADKSCYYMDLVSALAGSDGYLPANETTDGVHFSAKVYQTWLDYVKTHYA